MPYIYMPYMYICHICIYICHICIYICHICICHICMCVCTLISELHRKLLGRVISEWHSVGVLLRTCRVWVMSVWSGKDLMRDIFLRWSRWAGGRRGRRKRGDTGEERKRAEVMSLVCEEWAKRVRFVRRACEVVSRKARVRDWVVARRCWEGLLVGVLVRAR